MGWTKRFEGSFDYINSSGLNVATLRMVGIKGKWRWSSPLQRPGQRKLSCGMKNSRKEAEADAEALLKELNAL